MVATNEKIPMQNAWTEMVRYDRNIEATLIKNLNIFIYSRSRVCRYQDFSDSLVNVPVVLIKVYTCLQTSCV